MSLFHELEVAAVNKETKDAVSIQFNVPDNLKEKFKFIQGQYLTIRLEVKGESINRSYSLCSNPYDGENLTIGVKRVENGLASNYLNDEIKPGDVIKVMEPMGNFHSPLSENNQLHYILFGGGSGITPMLSIIKAVLTKEANSHVTLFYGNKDEESIIFKDQLASIANEHPSRLKVVHTLEDQNGFGQYSGRMDKENCLALLRNETNLSYSNALFFICGPTPMMSEVKAALQQLQIPDEKINIEYFTEKADHEKESASVGKDEVIEKLSPGEKTKVKITFDGDEYEFEMDPKKTVLDAALDAGYDPPYSCMVAACCTCRAKLEAGKVEMEDRESLTDDEIENGYVLTCQSHPTSHGVVLNYDD